MEDRKISTRSRTMSDKEEKATQTVLEQAEALSHAWAVEAFGARTACGRANVSLCWRGGVLRASVRGTMTNAACARLARGIYPDERINMVHL